jgi:hypothetical protein
MSATAQIGTGQVKVRDSVLVHQFSGGFYECWLAAVLCFRICGGSGRRSEARSITAGHRRGRPAPGVAAYPTLTSMRLALARSLFGTCT